MSLATLDDITLLDSQYSGFDYPNTKQVVGILHDGTSLGGNGVIQQSGFAFRQATIGFVAETEDALAVQTLYEATSEVTFTDHDGYTRDVVVLDYSRSLLFGEVWQVSATLVEMSDPEPPGS
jgi:hypothetical protein